METPSTTFLQRVIYTSLHFCKAMKTFCTQSPSALARVASFAGRCLLASECAPLRCNGRSLLWLASSCDGADLSANSLRWTAADGKLTWRRPKPQHSVRHSPRSRRLTHGRNGCSPHRILTQSVRCYCKLLCRANGGDRGARGGPWTHAGPPLAAHVHGGGQAA